MPWEQTSAMDQRIKFIADYLSGQFSKSDLCRAYAISRPTAYKWIERYRENQAQGLQQRSRAPHHHPNQTDEEVREMIVATKLYYQSWGPKKVVDYLREQGPELKWPADSTAGEILKRAGLVKRRIKRRHISPYTEPFGSCQAPNQIWSADFKGDFALGNHRRCYPLTLSDNFSRYLLMCRALERTNHRAVRPWLEWAFREYGLPLAIRTDNGAPFASLALGGISELSKWWIQLGIHPQRIKPGKPSQNDVTNACTERSSTTLRRNLPASDNSVISICFSSSIIPSVPMRHSDERLPPLFTVLRLGFTRVKCHQCSTTLAVWSARCDATARSNGVAISSTSPKF
jgi:transposase InsO family protein